MYGELKRQQIVNSFKKNELVVTNQPKQEYFNQEAFNKIMKAFEDSELIDSVGVRIMDRHIALNVANEYAKDIEKANKLNTSHLVLKEITTASGKTTHRWVDPNKDNKEYAQHGSTVELTHKGENVKGKVLAVNKNTGEYAIKLDKEHVGKVVNKKPHQFKSPHEDDDQKKETNNKENKPKEAEKQKTSNLSEKKAESYAEKSSDEQLKNFINDKNNDPMLIEIAKETLQNRQKENKPDKSSEEELKTSKNDKKDGEKLTDKEASEETGVSEKQVDEAEKGEGDINRRFKTFERFSRALAKGRAKSMIAYGTGGVGKTYTITKEFEKQGMKEFKDGMEPGSGDYDYVKITGKATPAAVFQALWEHNGKTIMFDDCDSVLQHEDAINMFKGALDTSGDGTISYGSQRALKDSYGNAIPNRFDFNGRVAFVSNLPPDKVPQPLKSRSLRIDMTMTPEQTIDRIRAIAKDDKGTMTNLKFPGPDGKPMKYDSDTMEEAINFLDKYKNKTTDLNVRTIGSILSIIQEAKDDGDDDWESDAKAMIFSKSNEDELQALNDLLC